jgi:hypothetical protein
MISNEQSSFYGRQSYGWSAFSQPRSQVIEDTLQNCEIQIERKTFVLTLKENARGRFLRIAEIGGPRHSLIIIPAPGLKDFQRILADMVQAATEISPKHDPTTP